MPTDDDALAARDVARQLIDGIGRRCTMCRHFQISFPTRGYSELTPGDTGSVNCADGVKLFQQPMYGGRRSMTSYVSMHDIDEADFFRAVRRAETCESYTPRRDD